MIRQAAFATLATALALGSGGGVQTSRASAAAPAPPLPASLDRFDKVQLGRIITAMGWKVYGAESANLYMEAWSPNGLSLRLTGVQCATAAAESCDAFRIWYANPLRHPRGVELARQLNKGQHFLRTHVSANQPDGGAPYFLPERVVILKGGVSPAQIHINLIKYESQIVGISGVLGVALPDSYKGPKPPRPAATPVAPSGSGLIPGKYRLSVTTGTGNSAQQDICLTNRDVQAPIQKIAAEMMNERSGCSIEPAINGMSPMRCSGTIVEGNIRASGGGTSLNLGGNALIDTDGMGGRARIQFQGSASRIGDC